MDEQSAEGPYRINTRHGDDVGIWVCEGSGILISPYLFIQSVCPEPFPLPVSIPWRQAGPPPKPFRKPSIPPFLYGECGRVPGCPGYLHLLSAAVPAARALEKESALRDWEFPIRIVGIVVTLDKTSEDRAAYRFLNAFRPSLQLNRTLEWAKAQQIPLAIAALGYDANPSDEDPFRRRYGLAPQAPIVAGPFLVDGARQKSRRGGAAARDEGGIWTSILGGRKLHFDSEYAKQILRALGKMVQIHQERERGLD